MSQSLDFQSIMLSLQHFWADHGCLIWQPYYTQVGAGTMNPATFLRVLGPEPWNVAYIEPSIRPDDARYGENPNRMQQHYQLQVILKPDPGNPQELFLESLNALGIDPRKHDIRFVEDNWEYPALGAWGLGWEVWLDGQEITQFTYFQQAGGIPLDPVSVEITYGLDRIAIALQRVHGFREIRWNTPEQGPALTAGDVNFQAEREHSIYYFEVADVERLRQMYDLFEAEAKAALAYGLVLPAHDYVLKCSHTFNVLDTRGAIGVTERQAFFGRMRDLSRQVAEAYLEQRQRLEYPWLDGVDSNAQGPSASGDGKAGSQAGTGTAPIQAASSPAHFLLEVGTEELPAGDLDSALGQLQARLPAMLADLRLEHGEVRVLGTPRRLVISVAELAPRQADQELVVKGPPAARAFDGLGQPTPAAEGFARSKGVAVDDLQVREMDGGKYVTALVQSAGRPAQAVLAEALPGLIGSLRFDKSMRWNSSNVSFSRPVRWLLALFGDQVVPFEFAGLRSGRLTRGLRFLDPEEIVVQTADDYWQAISGQGIALEKIERMAEIQGQVESLAAEVQGTVASDPALLAEVTNLVEAPAGLRGSFEASHLELPREVLISVMKKHQRYFPVERGGKLLPYFIAVSNLGGKSDGEQDLDLVVEGNEHVIRARFADAAFFVTEDLKKPPEAYLSQLGTLAFQKDLGSMLAKTLRIQELVVDLAPMVGLDQAETAVARRAAELAKADLVTKMVVEMTSLQGIMGRYYALHSGETEAVANAIFEHYLPRYPGDQVPTTRPGLAVGMADRLDTLAGLFAAGLAPTGAKDPFAQRRAALGLVGVLIAWDLGFDLRAGIAAAAARLPIQMSAESQAACLAFIVERLRNLLLEQGFRYDVVEASLAAQGHNPARAAKAVKELSAWVQRPDWKDILPAYARCVRITRDLEERYPASQDALVEPAELALFSALRAAESAPRAPGAVDDFLNAFLPMIPAINRFFDDVLVMAEDRSLRENRLGLLQRIAALAGGVADLSHLEGF
ncbi:MAG TPA: glycine--tRNA ligase subunit beta [Anaerolineales bacterium]